MCKLCESIALTERWAFCAAAAALPSPANWTNQPIKGPPPSGTSLTKEWKSWKHRLVPGLKLLDKLDHPVAGQFIKRQKIGDRKSVYVHKMNYIISLWKSLTKYRVSQQKMSVGDFCCDSLRLNNIWDLLFIWALKISFFLAMDSYLARITVKASFTATN